MHFSLKLTILALCCGIAMAEVSTRQKIETNVMQLLMQTRMASRNNPSRSIACVDYYIPLIQDLTTQYDKDLRQCDLDEQTAKDQIDNSKKEELATLDATAISTCERLSSCPDQQKAMPILECFVTAGSDGSKSLYSISKDATALLTELNNEYRLIESRKNQCTSDTDRAYTEESTRLNNEMTNCILGVSEVPTTTATPVEEQSKLGAIVDKFMHKF